MTNSTSASCREILAGISTYLDGDLDAADCEAIERHCRECPSCAKVVEGLRETVGLCRQVAGVPLPEAVRQRARDRIRSLLGQPNSLD
jgi:anti-sigma factor (TIGR02949 family)